nr:hypothetical protein [Microbispora rosea]
MISEVGHHIQPSSQRHHIRTKRVEAADLAMLNPSESDPAKTATVKCHVIGL